MTPEQLAKSGSEHGEQRALFAWLAMAANKGFAAANDDRSYVGEYDGLEAPMAALERCFAIPNGGYRDKITAAKLKAEGVKKGVPDIFLPWPNARFAGLFIELKRQTTGKGDSRKQKGSTSDFQDDWLSYLEGAHYAVAVCYGWREAADRIQQYVDTYC